MAKKEELQEFKGKKGVWRTIGGRKVFIATGQSLGEAMKESGKFDNIRRKNAERRTAEKYDRANDEETELNKRERAKIREYREQGMSLEDAVNKADKEFENERDAIINKKAKMIDDLKKKEDIKGAEGKVYSQGIKGEKERLEDEVASKREKYLKSLDEHDYNNKKWWEENNKLQKDYYDAQDKYDKKFKEYIRKEKGELSWKDKAKLNDMEGEIKRESIDLTTENEAYYETYRNAERKNARIKIENPNEKYENIPAYAGFKEKFDKTWNKDTSKEVSAKMYTNDEFMEHLTNANWHTERRMLENAKLTNKQLEYIKNNTMVDAYSANLDKTKTEQLIKEAKIKYPKEINPTKYSVTSASISRYQNMFNEYKKLHPNTKMDLQKFARMMMDLG